MYLDQSNYINELASKFGVLDSKLTRTPMEAGLQLEKCDVPDESLPYRELIGSLSYIMNGTRPDISFSVNYLSRFQKNFGKTHFQHAKRVLKYLKDTASAKLVYGEAEARNSTIELYCDADFGSDNADRKSTSGILVTLFGDSIYWNTKKQPIVALSSAESEYISLSDGVREILGFKNLLKDMGVNTLESEPVCVYEDNQSTIAMIKNPSMTKRSKHIDLRYHFVKDVWDKNSIDIKYIPSNEQKADILTKSLGKQKFRRFSNLLNLDLDD